MSHAPYVENPDFKYITFLRDPVSRVISMWRFMRMRPQHSHIYGPITDINTPLEYYKANFANIRNIQTKLLAGVSNHEDIEATTEHLKQAKKNLSKFFFVGFTEFWGVSVENLASSLNWQHVPKTRVANSSKKERHNMSDADLEELTALEYFDVKLYLFAREILNFCGWSE